MRAYFYAPLLQQVLSEGRVSICPFYRVLSQCLTAQRSAWSSGQQLTVLSFPQGKHMLCPHNPISPHTTLTGESFVKLQ